MLPGKKGDDGDSGDDGDALWEIFIEKRLDAKKCLNADISPSLASYPRHPHPPHHLLKKQHDKLLGRYPLRPLLVANDSLEITTKRGGHSKPLKLRKKGNSGIYYDEMALRLIPF